MLQHLILKLPLQQSKIINMKNSIILTAAVLFTWVAQAQSSWNFDKTHSSVTFTIAHMVVSEVAGNFKEFSAEVKSDKADFSDLNTTFTIQAASVNTEDAGRDEHLRGADFFDASKYPTIVFVSTGIKKVTEKKYTLEGTMTLHGVTKPISWELTYNGSIKDNKGATHAGFKATTTIPRKDYNLSWNKTLDAGGVALGDEVPVTVHVELTRK